MATGPDDVPQQTPRAVTVAPPSELTLPPLVAIIDPIEVVLVVDSVAKLADGVLGEEPLLLQEKKIKDKLIITSIAFM